MHQLTSATMAHGVHAIHGSSDHDFWAYYDLKFFFRINVTDPKYFELVQTGWQLLFLDIGWLLSRKLNSVWFNQAVIFNFNCDFLKTIIFLTILGGSSIRLNDKISSKITENEKVICICASWPYCISLYIIER